MLDNDEFDPRRWEADLESPMVKTDKRWRGTPRRVRTDRFLKGPISWSWLESAMALPGKALAIGLMLWLQVGITGQKTVHFCQTHARGSGMSVNAARRGV